MSVTNKLFMLPNEEVALALGMKKEDINIKEKVNLSNDLAWATKTAKNELVY